MQQASPPLSIQAGTSGQITGSLVTVILLFLIILTAETIYDTVADTANRFQTLMDYTANAEDMALVIHQDSLKYPNAKMIGLSVNERTGIEFAYSFYIYVNPSTFTGSEVLKHVFHKGFGCPWPLMGPGVFLHGHENTMRVVMNTYQEPYAFVDIKNIPIQKWCHVVLNCYKKGLDVYVNGNLANRIPFRDSLPYQNFQDIILFSNANYRSIRNMESLRGAKLEIEGSFKGQLSRLIYVRYALSMNEIQALMARGPAAQAPAAAQQRPPYLADDWWSRQA